MTVANLGGAHKNFTIDKLFARNVRPWTLKMRILLRDFLMSEHWLLERTHRLLYALSYK